MKNAEKLTATLKAINEGILKPEHGVEIAFVVLYSANGSEARLHGVFAESLASIKREILLYITDNLGGL